MIFTKQRDQVAHLESQITAETTRADNAARQAAEFQSLARKQAEELVALTAELTAERQSKAKATEEQISIGASRLLASQGHTPVAVEPDSTASAGGIWEKYEAIKNPTARSKFWQDHKAQLLSAKR